VLETKRVLTVTVHGVRVSRRRVSLMQVQNLRLRFLVADARHCGSPSYTIKAEALSGL
jgi:hypothetical protein